MARRRSVFSILVLAATAATLAGCGQENRYVPPPPPKVTVATPTQQAVTRYLEANGNLAAVNTADLVARVAGFVASVNYEDGAFVKKGTLLFTIEPESYKVKVEAAKAAEVGAQATLKQAQLTLDRQADLVTKQATTQANYDQALAQRDSAQSSLDQARANTRLAEINYDYTQVAAPFDGIVTARQVSVGQYVGATATPTVLATIVQVDPIYVNFTVSEQDVLRVRAEMARRGITRDDLKKVKIDVGLQDEPGYPRTGMLDYIAPNINPSTGTLPVRGLMQNQSRGLLPGYFARVHVPVETIEQALLVPEAALGADQGGRYLLVVGADNTVEQRKVEVGPLSDDKRVIENGLKPDDRIIVGGIMRAIPGQKVDPQMQASPAAPPAAGASGR
jgi:RND family efflux transporter MFP subunit